MIKEDMVKTVPVSVIVPCYNCELTVGRAVESILSQTFPPKELILINDASQDGTLNIINDYRDRYPKWIETINLNTNVGAASARNAGWEIASCPYIAFLDADDSWHPKKIEIQYTFMKANPKVDVVGHLYSKAFNSHYSEINIDHINFKTRKIKAMSLLFKNYFSTPCVMMKRDLRIKFEDHRRHSEDLFLWQNLAFNGANMLRIEIRLAFIHKSAFSDHGLNSQLLKMESAELMNILAHFRDKNIGLHIFVLSAFYSILKFIVRVFIVTIKKLK